MRGKQYKKVAIKYADDVIAGNIIASDDVINACKRFKEDLQREDLEIRSQQPDAAISIIEGMFVHRQGETIEGVPLLGKPLILQPWQIFIIYNLLGFWYKGTEERRFKEALIFVARKNGKSALAASIGSYIFRMEGGYGAKVFCCAPKLEQADIVYNNIWQMIFF